MDTSRFLSILLITSSFLFTTACSKDDNNAAPGDPNAEITKEFQRPPELDIEKLQIGDCLSLQSLIQTINETQFDFPARQLTTNINSTWSSAVFAKGSFGMDTGNFSTFPMLKSAEQKDCETVRVQDNSGTTLIYNIQESTNKRIHIVYSKHEGLEELDDIYAEAAQEEPKLLELIVELTSPKALKLSYKANTLFPFCSTTRLYTYWKDSIIRWDTNRAALQQNETIDQKYFAKIEEIFATQPAPENVVVPFSTFTSGRFTPGLITPAAEEEPTNEQPVSETEVETPALDEEVETPPVDESVAEENPVEDSPPAESEATEDAPIEEVADETPPVPTEATVPTDSEPLLAEQPPLTEDGQFVLLSENQITTVQQKLSDLKMVKRCDVVD